MYVITVEFHIRPAMAAAFREAMLENATASLRLEPGCTQFDVCFDPQDPSHCFLYEIYDNEAAFKDHLASDHFKTFDDRVAPMIEQKNVTVWERAEA